MGSEKWEAGRFASNAAGQTFECEGAPGPGTKAPFGLGASCSPPGFCLHHSDVSDWDYHFLLQTSYFTLPTSHFTLPLQASARQTSDFEMWAHQDSNLGRAGYEPAALTAELWAHYSLQQSGVGSRESGVAVFSLNRLS